MCAILKHTIRILEQTNEFFIGTDDKLSINFFLIIKWKNWKKILLNHLITIRTQKYKQKAHLNLTKHMYYLYFKITVKFWEVQRDMICS